MHRKHIRATVGAGDVDVPIGTFAEGQYVRLVGGILVTEALPATIVSGVPPTLDNAIARWDGTTGTLLQNSLVLISDTAQVTGVTALNGRDIARWTDGPNVGGATDSAIALWDGATGRLLKNSNVTINDDGDITTPGDMNPDSIGSIPVGVLVRSSQPVTHTDNSVARWDGTTGHSLDDSAVIIDDSGNVTGVTTLNTRDPARWVDGPTPAVSVHGNITVWDGTSGRLVADSGLHVGNVVYFLEAEAVTGHLPEFTNSTGRRISDSGIISEHVVTSAAVGVDNRIARYDGALRAIQSSAVSIDDAGNVTGVTNLNGIPFGRVLSYTVGASLPFVDEVACFDTAMAPFTVSYRPVQITAGGAVTGVTTLNGANPADWVAGPASATNDAIARYDSTSGKLIQNSAVTVNDSGSMFGVSDLFVQRLTDGITPFKPVDRLLYTTSPPPLATANRLVAASGTGVDLVFFPPITTNANGDLLAVRDISMSGNINGRDPDEFVRGPGGATDNRLARFDGATGYLIQNSAITVDDSGNIAGAGTYNTVNVAAHAARHLRGGADSLFGSTGGWGDVWLQPADPADPLVPTYWSIGPTVYEGSFSTTFVNASGDIFLSYSRATSFTHAHVWLPYVVGDTGSNIVVGVTWSGVTTLRAHVQCGGQGGLITTNGGTVTLLNSSALNSIPPGGIIHVLLVAPSGAPASSTYRVSIRSVGASHTLYQGGQEIYEDFNDS